MGIEAIIGALISQNFLLPAILLLGMSVLSAQHLKTIDKHRKELNQLNEDHRKDFKELVETQQHNIKEITEVLTTIGVLVGVIKDKVLSSPRNGVN